MDGTNSRCVTIVERNFPPSTGITGESAFDLAQFLQEHYGFEVHVVYLNQGKVRQLDDGIKRYGLSSIYNGKGKIRRFIASMREGKRMMQKAIAINKGPIICMTSPPMLNFWASKLLPKDRQWYFWSMDLYPDAFVSAKLASKNNPLYRYFERVTYSRVPDKLIALGSVQASYLYKRFKKEIDTIILPCGVLAQEEKDSGLPQWKTEHKDKVIFGYCGNLGEAHNPEFVKACIEALDPKTQHFILVAYGIHGEALLSYARSRPGVTILDRLPRRDLKYIDVHTVTLKDEWVNVCVPSKLVSAVHMGCAFILCAREDCDNWQMMQDSGWLVHDDNKMKTQVAQLITSITKSEIEAKASLASKRSQKLQDRKLKAYHEIALSLTEHFQT